MFMWHPIIQYVTLYEHRWGYRVVIFFYKPKLYFASFLRYCELANIAVTQLPQAVPSLFLICLI